MGVANISGNILTDSGASLSSYLPLTGGTLTGGLNGTSATFSSIVGVNGASEAGWSLKSNGNAKVEGTNGTTVLQVNDTSTGGKAWSLISAGAGNAHSVPAGTFYLRNSSDGITSLQIASTGAATFNIPRTSGTNVDIMTLSDNVTGIQTSGFGVRILATSNNGQAKSAIAFEADGGTNNDTAIAFYTQFSAASLDRRMTINRNGNVGIGTSSPSCTLEVARNNGGSTGGQIALRNSSSSTLNSTTEISFLNDNGASASGTRNGRIISQMENVGNGASNMQFWTWNGSTDTERMRIPSGGGLCVGGTSFSGLNTAVSVNSASNSGFIVQTGGTNRGYFYTSGNNTYIETTNSGLLYCWVNGANGVYLTAGSTSWTANSDERLKDITGNIENAVDSLLTLRTVKHTWKTDEDKTEHLALIAQDVEKVLPQLIDKYIIPAKRGEEQIDKTEYLGVRYTELIPVLVKAIQEQQEIINNLSAKVTALEQKA